jgi:hypothetical protein
LFPAAGSEHVVENSETSKDAALLDGNKVTCLLMTCGGMCGV